MKFCSTELLLTADLSCLLCFSSYDLHVISVWWRNMTGVDSNRMLWWLCALCSMLQHWVNMLRNSMRTCEYGQVLLCMQLIQQLLSRTTCRKNTGRHSMNLTLWVCFLLLCYKTNRVDCYCWAGMVSHPVSKDITSNHHVRGWTCFATTSLPKCTWEVAIKWLYVCIPEQNGWTWLVNRCHAT